MGGNWTEFVADAKERSKFELPSICAEYSMDLAYLFKFEFLTESQQSPRIE